MSLKSFLGGAPERPLEIVITTGAPGVHLGVEARTGPRTAYAPPLRDKVAGRLALQLAPDGRIVEGGLLVDPAFRGKGVEALLRAAASREIAERRAGREWLDNAGPRPAGAR